MAKEKFVCFVCDHPCELTFEYDENLDNEPLDCPFDCADSTEAKWITVETAKKMTKYFGEEGM